MMPFRIGVGYSFSLGEDGRKPRHFVIFMIKQPNLILAGTVTDGR